MQSFFASISKPLSDNSSLYDNRNLLSVIKQKNRLGSAEPAGYEGAWLPGCNLSPLHVKVFTILGFAFNQA